MYSYQGIEFSIEDVIELYLSKPCIKRINKEKQFLEHFGVSNMKLTRLSSIVYLRFEYNNILFKVPIPYEYPFRAPATLYVNSKSYRDLLCFPKDSFVGQELKKYNISCLCCTTKLCSQNWSPAIKFFNLVEEYFKNKRFILNLCNKYWFSKFCQQNNIILEIELLILSFI